MSMDIWIQKQKKERVYPSIHPSGRFESVQMPMEKSPFGSQSPALLTRTERTGHSQTIVS